MSDKVCMKCEADSKDRPLVIIEEKGEEKRVCVKCLPVLIHG
ncbi:MAG: hypothetical protein ACOYVD_11275 [Bacillota bacterium]